MGRVSNSFQLAKDAAAGAAGQSDELGVGPQEGVPVEIMPQFVPAGVRRPTGATSSLQAGAGLGAKRWWRRALAAWVWRCRSVLMYLVMHAINCGGRWWPWLLFVAVQLLGCEQLLCVLF